MIGNPKVAFIIVCWNNQPLLEECFESVQSQSYNKHATIMIDNGSSDDSVSFTKYKYPWVDVYEAGTNLGFAKGNNVAIKYARQKYPELDYFVLLNTDARLDANWLETVTKFADRKPRGAIFQSTTLDYYDHAVIDSTHIYLARNGSGTQAEWRSLYKGERGPKKVFGVNAAAAIVSTRFLDAQPFDYIFDEKMFMYLEDVDLCARATVMGWDNYLVPGTLAYHMGSASSGKKPGFSLFMTYRNNMAVLFKNLPLDMLLRMIPALIRSDRHTIRHLRRIGQEDAIPNLLKGRVVGTLRFGLYIADWRRMHKYRKRINKQYLWQLMRTGD